MIRLADHVGELQLATGAAHLALGVARFRPALAAIARDGVVGVTQGDHERETAVWFLTSGAGFLLAGGLARWAQRQAGTLPVGYGVGLLGLGLAGAALMPRSGFWAVAANGLLALAAARAEGMPRVGRDRGDPALVSAGDDRQADQDGSRAAFSRSAAGRPRRPCTGTVTLSFD